MNPPLPPEKIRDLLGGYSTGTLTPEERAALMQAAIEDQSLFDALMDEEALREALSDRAIRAEVLAALQPKPRWWRTPWPWAALASATAAVALFVLLRPQPQPQVAQLPAERQMAANLPKSEALPSEIAVPRTLRSEDKAVRAPELQREAAARESLEKKDAGGMAGNAAPAPALPAAPRAEGAVAPLPAAAAPPPPPAEVRAKLAEAAPAAPPPPPAEVRAKLAEAAPVAPPPPPAEVRAKLAEAAPAAQFATVADAMKEERRQGREDMGVELAAQQPDGTWKTAGPGAPLPAGRALRLRLTSPVSGTLLVEPRLAAPLAVQAGAPAEWILPAQARGELVLRISLAAPPPAAGPMRMRAAKARAETGAAADSALVGGAANRPVSFPREIRLRIE